MWYVVQVVTGREDMVVTNVNKLVRSDLYKECFNPTYKVQKRFKGVWYTVERPLFPGYVIIDTENPKDMATALRSITGAIRILGNDFGHTPLPREEQRWIADFTQKGNRVIGLSSGVIEGDQVIITEGPLVNTTAWIKSINRHKRMAWLELNLCGRTATVKAGLSIIRRSPERRGAALQALESQGWAEDCASRTN